MAAHVELMTTHTRLEKRKIRAIHEIHLINSAHQPKYSGDSKSPFMVDYKIVRGATGHLVITKGHLVT